MRLILVLVAAVFAAVSVPVVAEEIDAATLEKVRVAAAKGYRDPDAAKVSDVKKSLAANGTGYCGKVTIEDMPDAMTTFHVVLETPSGPSVLRLSDYNAPETDPNSKVVHEMMQHFGCIK